MLKRAPSHILHNFRSANSEIQNLFAGRSGEEQGYQDFSLPGIFRSSERKFPVGTFALRNESSWELLLLGTNVFENFRSRERMFLGTFVPDIVSSLSDHGKGCWCCSESKSKKYCKMNANNTYLHFRTLLM